MLILKTGQVKYCLEIVLLQRKGNSTTTPVRVKNTSKSARHCENHVTVGTCTQYVSSILYLCSDLHRFHQNTRINILIVQKRAALD